MWLLHSLRYFCIWIKIKSLAHSVPPLLSEKEVKSFSIALFGEFESDVEVYTKEKGNPLKYD